MTPSRDDIIELSQHHPLVAAAVIAWRQDVLSWDEAMMTLVVSLVAENQIIAETLTETLFATPPTITTEPLRLEPDPEVSAMWDKLEAAIKEHLHEDEEDTP